MPMSYLVTLKVQVPIQSPVSPFAPACGWPSLLTAGKEVAVRRCAWA